MRSLLDFLFGSVTRSVLTVASLAVILVYVGQFLGEVPDDQASFSDRLEMSAENLSTVAKELFSGERAPAAQSEIKQKLRFQKEEKEKLDALVKKSIHSGANNFADNSYENSITQDDKYDNYSSVKSPADSSVPVESLADLTPIPEPIVLEEDSVDEEVNPVNNTVPFYGVSGSGDDEEDTNIEDNGGYTPAAGTSTGSNGTSF